MKPAFLFLVLAAAIMVPLRRLPAQGAPAGDAFLKRSEEAASMINVGDLKEAEAAFHAQAEQFQHSLGELNPITLNYRIAYVRVLDAEGKYAESVTESRGLLSKLQRELGTNAPATLAVWYNLGHSLTASGKFSDARAVLDAMLLIQVQTAGNDNAGTLKTRLALATIARKERKFDQAERELRTVMTAIEHKVGVNHPLTLAAASELAACLASQGKLREAIPLAERAYDITKRIYGEKHPDTKDYEKKLIEIKAMGR